MSFATEFEERLKAGYPLIWINSKEEDRVVKTVEDIAKRRRYEVMYWSAAHGIGPVATRQDEGGKLEQAVSMMMAVVRADESDGKRFLFLLMDAHTSLIQYGSSYGTEACRHLRDLVSEWSNPHLKSKGHAVVVVSPTNEIPMELRQSAEILDVERPTADELGKALDGIVSVIHGAKCPADARAALVRAALGMTYAEAENAFSLAAIRNKSLSLASVQTVFAEKCQNVKKSKCLTLRIPTATGGLSRVGGFDRVKDFAGKIKRALSPEARAFGRPMPKGLLLIGVMGCGKSLITDMLSVEMGLPLLNWNLGATFGSLQGETGQNTRETLEIADAMAPCILRLDEADRQLSGSGSSDKTDGGTGARLISDIMTWLQEHTSPVYVVCTMNQIDAIPEAFLRQGRFDAIFGADLPVEAERKDILSILLRHLSVPRDPATFDIAALAAASEGYSGAELEGAITRGLDAAFEAGRELQTDDIMDGIATIKPMVKVDPDGVRKIQAWIKEHAEPVSSYGLAKKAEGGASFARRIDEN